MKKLMMVCMLAISGCGGGGGSGGASTTDSTLAQAFGTLTEVNSVQLLKGQGYNHAVIDWFRVDLNRDGTDELILAGRQTQPVQGTNHRHFNLQVYGWNTGRFTNETQAWFGPVSNTVVGTEPAVRFGDFNGDGHVDILIPPSTDMEVYGPAVVLYNDGSRFSRKDIDIGQVWAHDAAVADLNNDGYADFLLTDYGSNMTVALGSRTGNFSLLRGRNLPGASSVIIADFLSDGTKTILLTDVSSESDRSKDTSLYRYSLDNNTLTLTKIATLPINVLWTDRWRDLRVQSTTQPHEFRAKTMDFNSDGRPDVIIVSTLSLDLDRYPEHFSALQFLRNDGNGMFTDVTDTVLASYDNGSHGSYEPLFFDANADGKVDIFLSAGENVSGKSMHNSTRLLMQGTDDRFRDAYTDIFRQFHDAMMKRTPQSNSWAVPMTVVMGPEKRPYLIGTMAYSDADGFKHAVYIAEFTCMIHKMKCQ